MKPDTKAVIFDMDGVIVDSERIHARAKMAAFAHYHVPFDEVRLPDFVGRTSVDLYSTVLAETGRTDVPLDAVVKCKQDAYIAILEKGEIPPVEGAIDLIRRLHASGMPLALATSSWKRSMNLVIDTFHIRDCFTSILSGSELPKSKPDPAIYLLSADRLHTPPADCTVIEDATSGILAAKRAGMKVIAYRNPASGPQDLSLADTVVDSMGDVWEKIYCKE